MATTRGDWTVSRDYVTSYDSDNPDYALELAYKGATSYFVDSDIAADLINAMFEELPKREQEKVLDNLERYM